MSSCIPYKFETKYNIRAYCPRVRKFNISEHTPARCNVSNKFNQVQQLVQHHSIDWATSKTSRCELQGNRRNKTISTWMGAWLLHAHAATGRGLSDLRQQGPSHLYVSRAQMWTIS